MDNEEGVQEQMKADMSALKDQMASIMEAMLKIQKSIEDNDVAVASNTTREAEPVLQPAINSGRDRNATGFNRRYKSLPLWFSSGLHSPYRSRRFEPSPYLRGAAPSSCRLSSAGRWWRRCPFRPSTSPKGTSPPWVAPTKQNPPCPISIRTH